MGKPVAYKRTVLLMDFKHVDDCIELFHFKLSLWLIGMEEAVCPSGFDIGWLP